MSFKRTSWALAPGLTVLVGDCIEVMAGLGAESVDAIVTDPPYELAFMGRRWDASGVAFRPETWAAALRVLRPGGHLLAFGGTRTSHRVVCAIEDAGFEIRDSIVWLYGSGFPKSLDVSKAIDKAAGAERTVTGVTRKSVASMGPGEGGPGGEEATRWQGWGTALKPAHEPICVARKPLVGTVARNVLEHGTGALNIDACRIGSAAITTRMAAGTGLGSYHNDGATRQVREPSETEHFGRWPANVVLDEDAARELDEQSGQSGERPRVLQRNGARQMDGWGLGAKSQGVVHGDSGGASRFFYCAKASRAERNAGLVGFPVVEGLEKRLRPLSDPRMDREQERRPQKNHHPTVKPLSLMRWLVRLVTPPGGLILDPFAGSGSTGCAAVLEGFPFVGVEREREYAEIAEARIAHWAAQAVPPPQLRLEAIA